MWHVGNLKLRGGGNPEFSKRVSDLVQGTLRCNGTGNRPRAFPNKLGKNTLFLSKSDKCQRRNECPLVEICTTPGDIWQASLTLSQSHSDSVYTGLDQGPGRLMFAY